MKYTIVLFKLTMILDSNIITLAEGVKETKDAVNNCSAKIESFSESSNKLGTNVWLLNIILAGATIVIALASIPEIYDFVIRNFRG